MKKIFLIASMLCALSGANAQITVANDSIPTDSISTDSLSVESLELIPLPEADSITADTVATLPPY